MKIIIDDPLADITVDDNGITFRFLDGEIYGSNISITIEFNMDWSGDREEYRKKINEAFDNG